MLGWPFCYCKLSSTVSNFETVLDWFWNCSCMLSNELSLISKSVSSAYLWVYCCSLCIRVALCTMLHIHIYLHLPCPCESIWPVIFHVYTYVCIYVSIDAHCIVHVAELWSCLYILLFPYVFGFWFEHLLLHQFMFTLRTLLLASVWPCVMFFGALKPVSVSYCFMHSAYVCCWTWSELVMHCCCAFLFCLVLCLMLALLLFLLCLVMCCTLPCVCYVAPLVHLFTDLCTFVYSGYLYLKYALYLVFPFMDSEPFLYCTCFCMLHLHLNASLDCFFSCVLLTCLPLSTMLSLKYNFELDLAVLLCGLLVCACMFKCCTLTLILYNLICFCTCVTMHMYIVVFVCMCKMCVSIYP